MTSKIKEEAIKMGFKIIFDNGGGATLQTENNEFVASYRDMAQLAEDARKLQGGESTAGWDGHDESLAISDEEYAQHAPNGGYRAISSDELDHGSDRTVLRDCGWHNIEDFLAAYES